MIYGAVIVLALGFLILSGNDSDSHASTAASGDGAPSIESRTPLPMPTSALCVGAQRLEVVRVRLSSAYEPSSVWWCSEAGTLESRNVYDDSACLDDATVGRRLPVSCGR